MSYELIRQKIESDVFSSGFTIGGSAANIKLDGIEDGSDAPYIALSIEHTFRQPYIANIHHRYTGFALFDIVVDEGAGTKELFQTADQIVNRYGNKEIDEIQYLSISASQPTQNRFRITVPFEYDTN